MRDPQPDQNGVDQAQLRIVHEAPQDRVHHAGQHPGQQHQRPHQAAGREFLVQQQRRRQPDHVLKKDHANRPVKGIVEDLLKNQVVDQFFIMFQADINLFGIGIEPGAFSRFYTGSR